MKKTNIFFYSFIMLIICFFTNINSVHAQENIQSYDGQLGIIYTSNGTTFNVWSPSASNIKLTIGDKETEVDLIKKPFNLWSVYVEGDLINKTYTYTVSYENGEKYENVLDPYGKYLNEGKDKNIVYEDSLIGFNEWYSQNANLKVNDKQKIIYGLDVNGFTSSNTWSGNNENRGKLLGIIEEGTRYSGILTGFDYLKSIGISYVEIDDVFDANNPYVVNKNFTSGTEGYAGNLELKKVVNKLYLSGIGTIISINVGDFNAKFYENLDKIAKGYYLNGEGKLDFTKDMTKKYIMNLFEYLVKEYKLEGIKLEKIGDWDYTFINEIISKLKKINENLLIYIEGESINKNNLNKINDVSYFNGSFNYALLGDLNSYIERGLLSGYYDEEVIESLKFTLLSGGNNGDIDYNKVKGISYANELEIKKSFELINYLGASKGLSIYDKLYLSGIVSDSLIKQKFVLAMTTLVISGGIPYVQAGNEFLMSYIDSGKNNDSICDEQRNFCFHTEEKYKILDWSFAYRYNDVVNSFKSLINFRKANNNVVQTKISDIKKYVKVYYDEEQPEVIGYVWNNPNVYTKQTEKISVLFNFSNNDYQVKGLKGKNWIGLYNINNASREDDKINMYGNSVHIEYKVKKAKVGPWFSLIFVISIIGLLYSLNILLNRKLIEQGHDIKEIKRKYRPFVRTKFEKSQKEESKNSQQDEIEKDKEE